MRYCFAKRPRINNLAPLRPSEKFYFQKRANSPSRNQSISPIPTSRGIIQPDLSQTTINKDPVETNENFDPETDLPPDLAPHYQRELIPSTPPVFESDQGSPQVSTVGSALADPARVQPRSIPSGSSKPNTQITAILQSRRWRYPSPIGSAILGKRRSLYGNL